MYIQSSSPKNELLFYNRVLEQFDTESYLILQNSLCPKHILMYTIVPHRILTRYSTIWFGSDLVVCLHYSSLWC